MLNCSYSSVLAAFLFQGIVYTTNVPTNEDLGTWWLQSELQGALVWWLASRSLGLFPYGCGNLGSSSLSYVGHNLIKMSDLRSSVLLRISGQTCLWLLEGVAFLLFSFYLFMYFLVIFAFWVCFITDTAVGKQVIFTCGLFYKRFEG